MQMSLPGVVTGFPGARNLEERKDFDDGASDQEGFILSKGRREKRRHFGWLVYEGIAFL